MHCTVYPDKEKRLPVYSIPTMIFLSQQQAENALSGLNGKLALSKPLVVDWAKKKTGLTVSRLKQYKPPQPPPSLPGGLYLELPSNTK